jgi:GT2 family glycosyltransferase
VKRRVSFVVPTFRRPETLRETLGALASVEYPKDGYEVIVVDDGSDAETEKAVREFRDGAVAVTYAGQANRGSATARNHGARLATGDLLIFCDDDIVVEPRHVEQHLATHEVHGDCLVNGRWEFSAATLAALQETPFGRFRISLDDRFKSVGGDRPLGDGCVEPATVTACNLSVHRELFWDLGGFDEAFPWAGAEDQDVSFRARQAGHRLIRNDAIRVFHNDPTVTFRQFCLREERAAETVAVLAHKHPGAYARLDYVVQNNPVSRGDPPRVVLKKIAKVLLSSGPSLTIAQRAIELLERTEIAERHLERLYSAMIGLHMFRGLRRRLKALGAT